MKPHLDRVTRNFGSFMCLRNLPRLLLDETAEVIERGVPNEMIIVSHVAAKNETLVPKPRTHFGSIPKKIWLKLTGQAGTR